MNRKPPLDSSASISSLGSIDYEAELNPAQLEAVTTVDGPILVVAGAGSGKTRTLTFRVAYLVEQGVLPESILLLTFTRKSSAEMIRRAGSLVGPGCNRVSGGTFHGLAHELLRSWCGRLGYPSDFGIMDRGDMEELLGQLRRQAGLAGKEKKFPRASTVATIISKSNNKIIEPGELVTREYAHLIRWVDEIRALARDYTIYKEVNHLMDLDDLLLQFFRLLATDEEARQKIAEKYQYIMVDEFQDTNPVQADIIHLLGKDHKNVMVVGDDAQSIYSFRGASFRNIMEFPNRFTGTKIIRLEENYRSTQPILDLTNHIISKARERYEKNLFTKKGDGGKPTIVTFDSEDEQSEFICRKVKELADSGVDPDRVAVLFRVARHSFNLEIELLRQQLAFVKYGGRRFLEKAHIKDLLALLRVVGRPTDGVSLTRVLLQLDGVGPKSASNIIAWVEGKRERLLNLDQYKAAAKTAKVMAPLAGLFSRIAPANTPLETRVSQAWEYYQPIMERKFVDDFPDRMYDVDEFLRLAAGFESLTKLLADMALEPPDASPSRVESANIGHKLVLSTVHSAKGLEWHTVFILWATEQRFPPPYSKKTPEDLEEERRLMYVASTRAEENLYFLCPPDSGEFDRLFGPGYSPFLVGVPDHMIDINSGGRTINISKQAENPEPPAPPPSGGFSPNQLVRHRVFGIGRVVKMMTEQKIRVNFDHFGIKTLMIDYAGLEPVD